MRELANDFGFVVFGAMMASIAWLCYFGHMIETEQEGREVAQEIKRSTIRSKSERSTKREINDTV